MGKRDLYRRSLIVNAGINAEDAYILHETLVDVVENKIIINISKIAVNNYWRRNLRYEVCGRHYSVSISPEIELFASMENDEERFNYVEENWKNLVRIALSNLHKEYFTIIEGEFVSTTNCFEKIKEENSYNKDLYGYLKSIFPDLNYFHLYDGYNGEDLGYVELK